MSKPIEQFADIARRFCWWAESEPQDPMSNDETHSSLSLRFNKLV
jgi:hypothetical protein